MCICLLTGCGKDVGQVGEATMVDTTIDVSEMQQESEDTQEADATSEEATTEDTQAQWQEEFAQARRMDYYGKILETLQDTTLLPDEEYSENNDYTMVDIASSKYAIFDVDCDGKDELLIYKMYDNYTGKARIYEYDVDANDLVTEIDEYPLLTCYENGAVTAGYSHNQGLGASLWPFAIYTYDSASNTYMHQGNVDTWEKSFAPQDSEGNIFPDNLDTDGDGVLYYVMNDDGNGTDSPKTKAEYEEEMKNYTGGSAEIEIPWKNFGQEDYIEFGKKNREMFLQQYQEKSANYGTDLGWLFMNTDDNEAAVQQIEVLLQDSYGVSIGNADEYGLSVQGTLDETEIYGSGKEGPANFYYCGKQVGDITVCGIYPGMKEEDAIALLRESGFYWSSYEGVYISGRVDNNYYIDYMVDSNKTVDTVRMGMFCKY